MRTQAFWKFFCISLLLALGVLPAAAQVIVPPPPPPDGPWLRDILNIDFERINVRIDNQIASTEIDMQFTNKGGGLAEGTFIFPLPRGAAVERLTMFVDGLEIDAKILRAEEARAIYDEIVRQYRDPALLEFIGQDVIQASVFPIPAGESRRVQIVYGELLNVDNGLVKYVFPLKGAGSFGRAIDQMSIRVDVTSNTPISNVYSPSHGIALSRPDDKSFVAGFERSFFLPDNDFVLFYGLQRESIDANLLSYRESANEDGFFLLMLQPPLRAAADRIQAKDVVIVLDQSGSMQGEKWTQAQAAVRYVLRNLNENDRFNVVAFSTGWRIYANEMLPAREANAAVGWVDGLFAEGGTDIHGSLKTALGFTQERPMTILFLTDGIATEGIVNTDEILTSLKQDAPANARIFTFGVGNDVDTFLLDRIVTDFRGAGTYVRPGQRIDEEVASLYNKISAPVMNDVTLEIDGVLTEQVYSQTLPDLFAGEQLVLVGRYRQGSENATIRLTGTVDGREQTIVYANQSFTDRAGGEGFIARLWATRRIGDLLNRIRLSGENKELVDSVVSLSIRYGIITPYTSFLIEEDDILSERGRAEAAENFADTAADLSGTSTGASAVDAAEAARSLSQAGAPAPAAPMSTMTAPGTMAPGQGGMGGGGDNEQEGNIGFAEPVVSPVQTVGDKTFLLQGAVWTDTTFNPDAMETTKVEFLSDAYFDLLAEYPEAGAYLALGERVIVVLDGTAYEVVPQA